MDISGGNFSKIKMDNFWRNPLKISRFQTSRGMPGIFSEETLGGIT